MNEPLDELYLRWLYSRISSVRLRDPRKTYWRLARQLYKKQFVWFVPNDDNRVEDGKELRYEFIHFTKEAPDRDWMEEGCSMLEMLVGLSRRLAFEDSSEVHDWFWKLIRNMNLLEFTDARYTDADFDYIDDILDNIIFRTYRSDGEGGLFPLMYPQKDQRKVELWYQLSSYLLERE
jgi:hypothetical protein